MAKSRGHKITARKVILIAGPRIVAPGNHVMWRLHDTPALALTEFAARVCYRSDPRMGRNPGFVWARMREGHVSVFEHARYVFRVNDVENTDMIREIESLPGTYVEKKDDGWIISVNGSHLLTHKKNRIIRAMFLKTEFFNGKRG